MAVQFDAKPVESGTLRIRIVAISASLIVGLLLMAAKFYVYQLTNSAAILSDALESIINVVASGFALASVILSAQPPDDSHPYGHGKIEFFSAGFEGALIMLAAVGIFISAVPRMLAPQPLPNLGGGLFLLFLTAGVNSVLGILLLRTGRKTGSLTLIADGRHVLTDVFTSIGVLLGLFLVYVTGWLWLDGLLAALVGVNILVIGVRLVWVAFHGLMDASDPDLIRDVSDLLIRNRQAGWIDVHRLRTMRSGNLIHIDLHLILPRYWSLDRAHLKAKELEEILVNHFNGNARALIHLDPCEDPDCPVCEDPECEIRREVPDGKTDWNSDSMRRFGDHRYYDNSHRKK